MNIRTLVLAMSTLILILSTTSTRTYGQLTRYCRKADYSLLKTDMLEYDIRLSAIFALGSMKNCPPIVGYEMKQSSDTFYVMAFYDIRGAWQHFACERLDTVSVVVPS